MKTTCDRTNENGGCTQVRRAKEGWKGLRTGNAPSNPSGSDPALPPSRLVRDNIRVEIAPPVIQINMIVKEDYASGLDVA